MVSKVSNQESYKNKPEKTAITFESSSNNVNENTILIPDEEEDSEEYNEDGVCTLDDEYTYWEWQFKEGNFYDEFSFSAEYMDDLDEFLEFDRRRTRVPEQEFVALRHRAGELEVFG